MKKLSNRIAMVAMSLTLTIATPTAAFAGVNAVPSQPVDLTYEGSAICGAYPFLAE